MNPYQPPIDDSPGTVQRGPQLDPATAKAIGDKIKRLNRNSLMLGAAGFALQCTGRFSSTAGESLGAQSPIALLLTFGGVGVLVYALSLYARMRNQSPWWGALGLLSCIGLLGLVLLPKKCHFCNARTKGKQCAQCGAPAPL
ncbi:MAG: hypothetical protein QM756_42750 [Polyangiaceae bacterium]